MRPDYARSQESEIEQKSDEMPADLNSEEIDQLARVLRAHGFEGPPRAEAALRKAHLLGFDVYKIENAYAARGRFDSRYVLSNVERRLLLEFDTLAEEMRNEIESDPERIVRAIPTPDNKP